MDMKEQIKCDNAYNDCELFTGIAMKKNRKNLTGWK